MALGSAFYIITDWTAGQVAFRINDIHTQDLVCKICMKSETFLHLMIMVNIQTMVSV